MSRPKFDRSAAHPVPFPIGQLLGDFSINDEMGGGFMGLKTWQREVARRSKAFRALFRTSKDSPDYVEVMSLTAIWERCGSPDVRSPADFITSENVAIPGNLFDVRPDGQVFAAWEEAAFYAHFVEPEDFTIDDVCSLLFDDRHR